MIKVHGSLGSAVWSDNRQYRYVLTRGDRRSVRPVFIMLNPSYASEERSDHTVTKCIEFARRWGYSGIMVANLFAYVSTDPRQLVVAKDPVGYDNDRWILRLASHAEVTHAPVVCAWGNNAPDWRVEQLEKLVPGIKWCLGTTSRGMPKHPLRLAYNTELREWKP